MQKADTAKGKVVVRCLFLYIRISITSVRHRSFRLLGEQRNSGNSSLKSWQKLSTKRRHPCSSRKHCISPEDMNGQRMLRKWILMHSTYSWWSPSPLHFFKMASTPSRTVYGLWPPNVSRPLSSCSITGHWTEIWDAILHLPCPTSCHWCLVRLEVHGNWNREEERKKKIKTSSR